MPSGVCCVLSGSWHAIQRSLAKGPSLQAAYRKRAASSRKRDVTIRDSDFLERIEFIRDCAGDVARASIANWRGWRGSTEMPAFALQQDLDDLLSRIDALLSGDNKPFSGPDWTAWRLARERQRGAA